MWPPYPQISLSLTFIMLKIRVVESWLENKGWPGVISPWGFSPLTFAPGPRHQPDLLDNWAEAAAGTPKLKDHEPGPDWSSEIDRRTLTQHLLPAGHTSKYITCVKSFIPLGNPMRQILLLLTTLPNGETEAPLMLGTAWPPSSDSSTHPIISWTHVCFPSKANKSSNLGFPRYDMNISHVDGQRFGQN